MPQIISQIEIEGTLPIKFYDYTVAITPKLHKYSTNKECSPISLMDLDTKILNQILTNQIPEHIKTLTNLASSQ